MRVSPSSLIMAAFAAEAFNVASASSSPRHHRSLASKMKRAVGLAQEHNDMQKRQTYSGSATWYGAGVSEGACGVYSSASDNIVALNTQLYGNDNVQSSWCGKSLVITGGGVTQTATVVDACPTCPGEGDLDMSTGLFQSFGMSLDTGEFSITWHVAGEGGSSSSGDSNSNNNNNNEDNAPKTTHTQPHTTSTHTHTTQTPSSTPISSSTTSTALPTVTSISLSLPIDAPFGTSTVAPVATGVAASASSTSNTDDAQNLAGLSELMEGLFNIANAGQT